MWFPKGKHVSIDPSNPEALGFCDYTKFIHNRKDLVKQMEWRGNALVWTGFYVGKDYVDKPNPQLKTPILPPDPVPVRNPRLAQPTVITWAGNYNYTWPELTLDRVGPWCGWTGTSNGIPALPTNERLALLEEGGLYGAPSITQGTIVEQQYTQNQIRSNLQNTNWNLQFNGAFPI